MIVLAIESSTPTGSIALYHSGEERALFAQEFVSDRAHNSVIFEPLAAALEVCGQEAPDRIVVGTGPGSYSGVRVGIAVANGLAVAFGAPVLAAPSISALDVDADTCLVAGDDRRNSYYLAEIENRRLLSKPRVMDAETFREAVAAASVPVFTTDPVSPLGLDAVELARPVASRLARLGAELEIPDAPIEPLYIREPYITTPKRRPHAIRP